MLLLPSDGAHPKGLPPPDGRGPYTSPGRDTTGVTTRKGDDTNGAKTGSAARGYTNSSSPTPMEPGETRPIPPDAPLERGVGAKQRTLGLATMGAREGCAAGPKSRPAVATYGADIHFGPNHRSAPSSREAGRTLLITNTGERTGQKKSPTVPLGSKSSGQNLGKIRHTSNEKLHSQSQS